MADYVPDIYTSDESHYTNEYEEEFFHETFTEVWENCAIESIKSIISSAYLTIIVNAGFGFVTSFELPEYLFHCLSTLCGMYILNITLQSAKGLMVLYILYIGTYIIIALFTIFHKRLKTTKVNKLTKDKYQFLENDSVAQYGLIIFFVFFEHILLERETWLEIRGIMMVFSMKLISLLADLELNKFPNFLQYCGYMFSCGNILFGPWISFENYMLQFEYPTKKGLPWIIGIIRAIFLALFFLTVSNCWASYFISDNSNRLFIAYKEALSFRASHYFICFFSEALMLASGWKNKEEHYNDESWNLTVTNPLKIEFPTALSIVVVNWNKPMHTFFKKYIYRKWLPLGKFYAVFLTFIISSLFHGFEIKISVVLISLGVFSYLQILVRDTVSQTFDMCAKVYPCKACNHKIKSDNIMCICTKFIFSTLTLLHLIYLGILMDQSTDEVGIYEKWNHLYFYSLWIMLVNFLIVK